MKRLRLQIAYFVERMLMRGTHYRLAFMAALIAVVSLTGGIAVLPFGGEGAEETVWWAFLRLTDPGYLGDDEGMWRRLVSTTLTIAGYVLFMGALVAIMTQWLHDTIERFERGETDLVLRNHILLLRMTERTPLAIAQILQAEDRVERFLKRFGGRARIRIVVLVEELTDAVVTDLREFLDDLWDDDRIILRSGSCLNADHLERVNFREAAAILIPSGLSGLMDSRVEDAETIKAVLSIANHPGLEDTSSLPRVIAEVHDWRLSGVVKTSYRGVLELIPSHTIVSRLFVHTLRHRGLSLVLGELLTKKVGNDLFFLPPDGLVGTRIGVAARRFRTAILLGIVRKKDDRWVPLLNPHPEWIVEAEDRLVVIAPTRALAALSDPLPDIEAGPSLPPVGAEWKQKRRVLILGWNRNVAPILRELDTYGQERFEIEIASVLPLEERQRKLKRAGIKASSTPVTQHIADYTDLDDVRALNPETFHTIVILGRDWVEDGETSDAQTILGYHVLLALLGDVQPHPNLIVELTDPENAGLFDDRPGEVVLSPLMMSHILAHMALQPALGVVLDELFTVGGAEIHYRPIAELGIAPGPHSFAEVRDRVLHHGEVPLGLRLVDDALARAQDTVLNPSADAIFELGAHSSVLVLTTYPAASTSS